MSREHGRQSRTGSGVREIPPAKRSGMLPSIGRTVALSDLHLGRVSTRAKAPELLKPLVEGFDGVLLLGDVIDHWYTSAAEVRDLEGRLNDVCKAAGVKRVVYFRGNHDASTETGEEFAVLDGVLYLHGHAVYYRLKGDGPAKARIQNMNQTAFGPHRIESRKNKAVWTVVDRMYGAVPMAMINPIAWPLPVVRRIRALVEEVAPGGGVRGVVLGHSHRAGVRTSGDVTMFNLGGWIRNTRACAFIREGQHAKLVHIDNRSHQLRYGKTLFERDLSLPQAAPKGLLARVVHRFTRQPGHEPGARGSHGSKKDNA